MTSPPNIRTKEDALEIIKYFRVADLQVRFSMKFSQTFKYFLKGCT